MKIFGYILAGIVFLVATLGIFAPKDFQIEREIIINKPKSFVFDQLKYVKKHKSWSPWAKLDPNIKEEFKGTDGTIGFIAAWAGNKDVGEGEQEITNIVNGERIDLDLRFKKPFEDTSKSYLITESIDAKTTKVKWGMIGKNKFPFNIVCLLMNMKKMLSDNFDSGLASMKQNFEK